MNIPISPPTDVEWLTDIVARPNLGMSGARIVDFSAARYGFPRNP